MAGPSQATTVTYGHTTIRIYPRGSGGWSINWREAGRGRSTTRRTEAEARQFADTKARALDSASGHQWISPARAQTLQSFLRAIGPDADPAAVVSDLAAARRILAGGATLETAARHYMQHGPGSITLATVADAAARFLAEYEAGGSPSVTIRPLRSMLSRFQEDHPGLLLSDLTTETLRAFVRRGHPEPRTLYNRINNWRTFLNRCRDWELLPAGRKHAAELLKRPRRPDTGKPILSLDQGSALLALVRAESPRLLPYLVLGGWLGLRPSECQRVEWSAFDWAGGHLHLSAAVAQKLQQERYIPIPAPVASILRPLGEKSRRARCCIWRSQEYLSRLARESGTLAAWPANVLRHSWFSYTLARLHNIHQLAEWGGNSPAVIRSNYRRPVPESAGVAWLQILDA